MPQKRGGLQDLLRSGCSSHTPRPSTAATTGPPSPPSPSWSRFSKLTAFVKELGYYPEYKLDECIQVVDEAISGAKEPLAKLSRLDAMGDDKVDAKNPDLNDAMGDDKVDAKNLDRRCAKKIPEVLG
jgi:hypothetical protein